MTCSSCGASVPANARFCPACGHALVARPDQRRVATVLFADLVGFTALSEGADPEQVKRLVDRCFERLAVDITDFGGHVDKVIGDALVAIFGAPVAHEDDAERAVRAALRMQARLAEICAEMGIEVRMRVGVNTGEVLVGALRAGGDTTAMGDVVNTASRLQELAAPGQVVVGDTTRAAAANGVRYEAIGPVAVKGREEPVDAWLAVEAVAPPGRRGASPRSPLVGRDGELAVLRAALGTAVGRSRAHLVVIAGEAGVGKTRLATELADIARCEHDAKVLVGHCIPYGESNEWAPIAALVANACGIEPNTAPAAAMQLARAAIREDLGLADDDPETGRLAEGLCYLMGLEGPGTDVDPGRAREDALRAVLTMFAALASRCPVVLVLSDLHWADEAVLGLLPRVLERVASRPVVIVGTTRSELLDSWSPSPGRHNTVHLNLDPLDGHDTDVLLRALLPDATDELLEVLRERSGGNPFFAEELAAMVGEDAAATTGSAELPATLHGLVAARLDHLPPAERNVLEDASVIGSSGPVALVELLAQARGAEAADALDALATRDLLELDDDEYAFRNELTREVAYGTLAKSERARRHGLLAKHLAEQSEEQGRVDDVLDLLAHHFQIAGELVTELGAGSGLPADMTERAVLFLQRAAERAERRESWKAQQQYLTHALKVLGTEDPARRLALLVARARSRAEMRDTVGARQDLDTARRIAEDLDDRAALATMTTILGDVVFKEGDLEGSAAVLEDAVAQWRGLDDPRGLADALRFRGMTDVFRNRLDAAAALIDEALALFRGVGDQRGEAWALQNLAWIAFNRGDSVEAERRLDASAKRFGEIGDWGGVAWALGLLAWVRFTQGKLEEARELAEQIHRESQELGNRWAGGMMQVLLSNIAAWTGEADRALREADAAREVFLELGDSWGEMQSVTPMILALNAQGRRAEAQAMLDVADAIAARVADSGMRNMPRILRVMVHAQNGDPETLPLIEAVNAELGDNAAVVTDERRVTLGLARLQHGDVSGALDILERAYALAPNRGSKANAGVVLALARVAAGRADEVVGLCDDLEDTVVTFVDRYRLELARAFARQRLGDGARADAALRRACGIVDATQSRLDQTLVRLAQAELRGVGDTLEITTRLGFRPVGWERVYRLMAGVPG